MSESQTDSSEETTHQANRKIRQALIEVRREGWKVATIYAVVDATLVALVVNLVVTIADVPGLPQRVPLPEVVLDVLARGGMTFADPTVATGTILGVLIGGIVFFGELGWRVHQPLVEQFETANPDLREALRTARDAVENGSQSQMAVRLYEDILNDLKQASSVGLLDLRRVTGTILVIAVISVATIQLAVVDISLLGLDNSPESELESGSESEYSGLQDGSSILGDPEDVPTGEEELDTQIDTSGSGSDDGDGADSAAAYNTGGFGDPSIETQRAGFSERERLEDAELIREYNLRIREEGEDT
jgi:hypothetical protein